MKVTALRNFVAAAMWSGCSRRVTIEFHQGQKGQGKAAMVLLRPGLQQLQAL